MIPLCVCLKFGLQSRLELVILLNGGFPKFKTVDKRTLFRTLCLRRPVKRTPIAAAFNLQGGHGMENFVCSKEV